MRKFWILIMIMIWIFPSIAGAISWNPVSYNVYAQLIGEEDQAPWFIKNVSGASYDLILRNETRTTKHISGKYRVGISIQIDGREGEIGWSTFTIDYTAPVGRPPSALPVYSDRIIDPGIPIPSNLKP
jgi:hypothetical protein